MIIQTIPCSVVVNLDIDKGRITIILISFFSKINRENFVILKKLDSVFGSFLVNCLRFFNRKRATRASPRLFFIIRPGGIGDAVHLIPTIRALKQSYPSATIDILAETRNASVFALCPQVDQIFHYDRPGEFLSVFRRRYDVIIDTEQWHRLSAVVARLIRSYWKIGFATNDRRRLFTHGVEYSHDEYEVESFSHLLTPLGVILDLDLIQPFLQVPLSAQQKAEQLLASINGPFVTLFPGASIPERRWGADRFKTLASRLRKEGWQVVVVGGGEDRETCNARSYSTCSSQVEND